MASTSLYQTVNTVMHAWEPDAASPDNIPRDLHTYLEQELAAREPSERVSISPNPNTPYCDFIIADRIGIKLFYEFSVVSARRLRLLAWQDDLTFDHLIVVGYNLPDKHKDNWRLTTSRLTTTDSKMSRIEFIHQLPYQHVSDEPNRLIIEYLEPMAAVLLMVTGCIVVLVAEPHPNRLPSTTKLITTVLFFLVLIAWYGLLRGVRV